MDTNFFDNMVIGGKLLDMAHELAAQLVAQSPVPIDIQVAKNEHGVLLTMMRHDGLQKELGNEGEEAVLVATLTAATPLVVKGFQGLFT